VFIIVFRFKQDVYHKPWMNYAKRLPCETHKHKIYITPLQHDSKKQQAKHNFQKVTLFCVY